MLENYIKMFSNDKNDKILSLRFNSFNHYSCFFFVVSYYFYLIFTQILYAVKIRKKNWFELFWGFQTTDTYLGFYGNLLWNFFEDFPPYVWYRNRYWSNRINQTFSCLSQKNFFDVQKFFCVKKFFEWKKIFVSYSFILMFSKNFHHLFE